MGSKILDTSCNDMGKALVAKQRFERVIVEVVTAADVKALDIGFVDRTPDCCSALGIGTVVIEIAIDKYAELGRNTQRILVFCVSDGRFQILATQLTVVTDKQRYLFLIRQFRSPGGYVRYRRQYVGCRHQRRCNTADELFR